MTALTVPDLAVVPSDPTALRPDVPVTAIVMVTPDMAKRWLVQNKKNRRVRRADVDKYARDMASGRWLLTGETIQFDRDGNLIDGQHRLHAVARSGATIPFNVTRGLAPEVQGVIDQGAKRTAGDMLGLDGHPNPNTLAAAARLGIAWEAGDIRHAQQSDPRAFTHSEIADFVDLHPALGPAASVGQNLTRTIPARPAVLAFTRWLTGRCDGADANVFFSDLAAMRTDGAGDPRYTLLRRLAAVRDTKERLGRVGEAFYIIRAWNAYRSGERLTQLKTGTSKGPSKFPEPV